MEITNKNIIQNNIEKIKKSMKRLKDTINRSNSNNFRNLKIYSQKHYNSNIENKAKNNLNEENKSFIYYNIKESLLNNNNNTTNNKYFGNFFSPKRFAYLNNEKDENENIFEYERTPFIQNINTDFNINKNANTNTNKNKTRIDISYNEQINFPFEFGNFGNKKENSENIPSSRNKIVNDFRSKTDILMKKKIINSPGVPNIIDISSNRLKEDNSLLNIINNNNYIDNLKLNRNKSAKQIDILRNIKKNNNNANINKNNSYRNNSYKDLFQNDNSLSNIDIFEYNNPNENKNKNNIENYLSNQIKLFNNINKGLLIRYNKIIKYFSSANEQNNILINKINELKRKEKKLKNINYQLETEYNTMQGTLSNNYIINENKKLLLKNNLDLKGKIDKYDEIILQLKNKINKIIEDEYLNKKIKDIKDNHINIY